MKKTIKSSQAQKDVAAAKQKKEFDNDVKSYFSERDKVNSSGEVKKKDIRQLAEAEAEVKDLLYKESLKEVPLPEGLEPMFNSVFLTSKRNRVRTETGLLLATALLDGDSQLEYSEEQTVMAAGPQVQQALTGSKVVIDFESLRVRLSDTMAQKVKKDSEIKVPIITINDHEYIHVSERNLKYISKKA